MINNLTSAISDREYFCAKFAVSEIGKKVRNKNQTVVMPVVYTYFDKDMNPLYTSKTVNIRKSHTRHRAMALKIEKEFMPDYEYLGVVFCRSESDMDLYDLILHQSRPPKYSKENSEETSGADGKDVPIPYHDDEGHDFCSTIDDISGKFKEYVFSRQDVDDWILPKKTVKEKSPRKIYEESLEHLVDNCMSINDDYNKIIDFLIVTFPELPKDDMIIRGINLFADLKNTRKEIDKRVRWRQTIKYLLHRVETETPAR